MAMQGVCNPREDESAADASHKCAGSPFALA